MCIENYDIEERSTATIATIDTLTSKIDCNNINCDTSINRICVNVTYTDTDNRLRHMYTVAHNECEAKYAACKPGITEVLLVPMENCPKAVIVPFTSRFSTKHKLLSGFVNKRYSDHKYENNVSSDEILHIHSDQENKNPDERNRAQNQNDKYDQAYEENEYAGIADEYGTIMLAQAVANKNVSDYYQDDFKDKVKNKYITIPNEINEEEEEDTNIIGSDYDGTIENKKVEFEDYKEDCPKQCPARHVMVCARCEHGIHRTFLSICHLKLFSCKHPNEKLELVSRKPCVQSAPFLTDLPEAKGKLGEPTDEDIVLKYIHCKNKGRLGRDDPRCKFGDLT